MLFVPHFTRSRRFTAFLAWLLFAGTAATLAGCGADLDEKEKEKRQAEQLFNIGREAMTRNRFQEAAERFEELEESYPFSVYTKRVSLALAYLNYRNYEYDKAIAILDQFIRLNPRHEHLDYAYYIKGLSHYYYGQGFLSILLKTDRTRKDPAPLVKAFDTFKTLHEFAPDSLYAEDAKLRTIVLRNMLAVYEIRVADYYLQRGAYVAVVNRIKYMLERYEGAQHTPEALILLATAYRQLHLNDLANDTLQVLELNYPNYYRDGEFGKIDPDDEKRWFEHLHDWADNISEILNLKPKY